MLKLQAANAEVCIFPREMTFFADTYLKKTSFLGHEKKICRNTFYWKSNNANIRICTKCRKNNSLRPLNRTLPGYKIKLSWNNGPVGIKSLSNKSFFYEWTNKNKKGPRVDWQRTPINIIYPAYFFNLTAWKVTKPTTAHQRLILEVQKPVEALIHTQNYPFSSAYMNSVSWPSPYKWETPGEMVKGV